ncbi:hypothetical protein [Paraflavitalea pollutisoli]|uniref:hypothetical protein n=1 Tax=Paraflavitalea pollutisoli TaxID=3034143 RepID=UPI0023ED5A52|nr:hypothetical protein [Paraflavitalea sp. H1-2-19X]
MKFYLQSATILACTLVCVASMAQARRVNAVDETFAQSLLKSGVDTVLIYRPYSFYGSGMISDSSVLEDISYIFSKKTGMLVVERLTSEYSDGYRPISTHKVVAKKDSLQIFDFLGSNFRSIFADTLLPGMVKYPIDGRDTLVRWLGSHAQYIGLVVLTKAGRHANGFFNDDLCDGVIRNEDGSVRVKFESINYTYNLSTSIYKITSLLKQQISAITDVYGY